MKSGTRPFVKGGLLVVVFSWLIYTAYRLDGSIDWLVKILTSQVRLAIGEPFLPILMGTVGLGVRTAAALVALIALVSYLLKRDFSKIVRIASLAVFLEAAYFLTFIPAAVTNIFFPNMLMVFVEAGIPIMAEVLALPVTLIALGSKVASKSYEGVVKWGCIVGLMYLFTFWLNYSMQWFGTFIMPKAYAASYPGYGIGYLLDYPLNMFSFLLTFLGLMLLAVFFASLCVSVVRGSAEKLNLKIVGATLTILGGYFLLVNLLFLIFGPVGGFSVWNEVFIYSIIDHWCVTFPALGIPLMLGYKLNS